MNIIAEIGSNWKDLEHAKSLIGQLEDIGVKLIKFQLFREDQAPEEYKSKVITEEMAADLVNHGNSLGVDVFFSTCYPEAVDICERIGVKYYKVRYKDRHNIEIMKKIKNTNKPYWISGLDLHVLPLYPAPLDDYYIGVSDHTATLDFFKNFIWEMHVKEDDDCLESEWSKKISDLKEVLRNEWK